MYALNLRSSEQVCRAWPLAALPKPWSVYGIPVHASRSDFIILSTAAVGSIQRIMQVQVSTGRYSVPHYWNVQQ